MSDKLTNNEILDLAREVLAIESRAVDALRSRLDDNFIAACELCKDVAGRIVVTGMGKSGHVSNKIAATLASTGTPALFVHPAEASHGDLGMITRKDAVVVLSNSGETRELAIVIRYCARHRIPMIGVASRSTTVTCRPRPGSASATSSPM